MRTAAILAILALGCSDEQPPTTTLVGREPPSRPSTTVRGGRRWFVVRDFWLGTREPGSGIINEGAWRDFGFDLDALTTNDATSEGCKRIGFYDGLDGIDNSFGGSWIPRFDSITGDWFTSKREGTFETKVNTSLHDGAFSLLIRIDGATDGDNAAAPGAVFIAAPRNASPAFGPTDRWPLLRKGLLDPSNIESARDAFTSGYVREGRWVSGDLATSRASLHLSLGALQLPLTNATVTLDLASGRGVIAGALRMVDAQGVILDWADRAGFCSDEEDEKRALLDFLQPDADLVADAVRMRDPLRNCDAVSVGIAFDAVPTLAPTELGDEPPPTTCK